MSVECLEIRGGTPLHGRVQVGGAKNAALPQLIAALLTEEPCTFTNVPAIEDIPLLGSLLLSLGAEFRQGPGTVTVRAREITTTSASHSLVKALRASFWVLGPLLARCGEAHVALPGGDLIGARPVDIHLEALAQLGASLAVRHGVVEGRAPLGLHPADITFRFPSVGATHQVLMTASLIPGSTTLRGAAREPEVVALAEMLTAMGASIEGAGTDVVEIRGCKRLAGGDFRLMGDRIEAGTYLLAGLASRGSIVVEGVDPDHLSAFLTVLRASGADVICSTDQIAATLTTTPQPVEVRTAPHPGFPTDLQAPLLAYLATVPGESVVEETVYEGRFGGASELCRLGASVVVRGNCVHIRGGGGLNGAPVDGHDIRAAAALVIAGVAASGVTEISEVHHLRRGYERLEEKLAAIGANARRRWRDHEDYCAAGC